MAISQQAAQQVAALLTQSLGLPGGQGAEIAQRLLSAANTSVNSSRTSSARTISRDNITTRFRNTFRPSEQRPFPSQNGIDGKDGTAGQGGRDGVAGSTGSTGATGAAGAAGAGGLSAADWQAIGAVIDAAIQQALSDFLDNLPSGGGGGGENPWLGGALRNLAARMDALERALQGGGKCLGQDVCGILKKQGNAIGQHEKKLKDLAKQVKDLEKKAKEQQKGLDAFNQYLPPGNCP